MVFLRGFGFASAIARISAAVIGLSFMCMVLLRYWFKFCKQSVEFQIEVNAPRTFALLPDADSARRNVAIVGGNGCGKSTMAKVVSGILPIDGGSVSILGETPSTPAESRALGISTVYQEVLVADESSVVDNIFMGSDRLFSKTFSQARKVQRAQQLME